MRRAIIITAEPRRPRPFRRLAIGLLRAIQIHAASRGANYPTKHARAAYVDFFAPIEVRKGHNRITPPKNTTYDTGIGAISETEGSCAR